jgi:glycosyltransferase involved in cell wall biosynthesis
VLWSGDIHVLDSISTDRTATLAQAAGAKVWQRPFDNFAAQQNWAVENIPFAHPWVLLIDADERCTPGLRDAMLHAVAHPGPHVAFRIQRRDFFLGAWLKHTQMTAYYDRLFLASRMRWEREVHQISRADGPVGPIGGYLDHFPFSKGVRDWVARHNKYSDQEATLFLERRRGQAKPSLRAAFFDKDVHERKRNLKEIYYGLPARPLFKFLLMYVVKRGFLDGRAGFAYCVLIAFYEYMIVLKVAELEATQPPA